LKWQKKSSTFFDPSRRCFHFEVPKNPLDGATKHFKGKD
jgi:hypothetical protein